MFLSLSVGFLKTRDVSGLSVGSRVMGSSPAAQTSSAHRRAVMIAAYLVAEVLEAKRARIAICGRVVILLFKYTYIIMIALTIKNSEHIKYTVAPEEFIRYSG